MAHIRKRFSRCLGFRDSGCRASSQRKPGLYRAPKERSQTAKRLRPQHILSYSRDSESHMLNVAYLEGQGDLVGRLRTPITHILTLFIPMIKLLTKSP